MLRIVKERAQAGKHGRRQLVAQMLFGKPKQKRVLHGKHRQVQTLGAQVPAEAVRLFSNVDRNREDFRMRSDGLQIALQRPALEGRSLRFELLGNFCDRCPAALRDELQNFEKQHRIFKHDRGLGALRGVFLGASSWHGRSFFAEGDYSCIFDACLPTEARHAKTPSGALEAADGAMRAISAQGARRKCTMRPPWAYECASPSASSSAFCCAARSA